MKMIHILDGPPLYTNCFLLVSEKGNAVAVDPAAPVAKFVAALEEENAKLTHIFLTHGHPDHVASADELRARYGAKLYMNEGDARKYRPKADVYFKDGETIEVDEMAFRILFTPGHTPGSTCIECGDYLFTGDTLFAEDIGRTDLPGGSAAEMKQSLQKLLRCISGDPQVFPGHEEFSTFSYEKQHNPYLRDL